MLSPRSIVYHSVTPCVKLYFVNVLLIHCIQLYCKSVLIGSLHWGVADKVRTTLLNHRNISARIDTKLLIDTWVGAGCSLSAGQDRRGKVHLPYPAFLCRLPASLWSSLPRCNYRGTGGHCASYTATPPGAAQGSQPGVRFSRYNSFLHLPSSTTFLPLFGLI